jgi:hypothetical protein
MILCRVLIPPRDAAMVDGGLSSGPGNFDLACCYLKHVLLP